MIPRIREGTNGWALDTQQVLGIQNKGPLGLLHFPSDFTSLFMVQDILNNIGVVLELLALRIMMERGGGVNTSPSGKKRFSPLRQQNTSLPKKKEANMVYTRLVVECKEQRK